MVSSQNRFMGQERSPMFVGLPRAKPSHHRTSSAEASSMERSRVSMPGTSAAPRSTLRAIVAVFPVCEW